jgi:hypothetical protein
LNARQNIFIAARRKIFYAQKNIFRAGKNAAQETCFDKKIKRKREKEKDAGAPD